MQPINSTLFTRSSHRRQFSPRRKAGREMSTFLNFNCKNKCLTLTSPRFKTLFLLLSSLCIIYLLVDYRNHIYTPVLIRDNLQNLSPSPSPTSINHLVFGIAGSWKSWPKRQQYVRLWWKPECMRGFVFLDQIPQKTDNASSNSDSLPPLLVSGDTSRIPYTCKGGLRSAIRVARVVSELVNQNLSDVRWFVFGDDDTVFFTDNLVKTLSKYDHNRWYYVGSNSESFEQNAYNSFDMAFGGGGFAISYPLAKVLARVLDSCLMRYSHLYGSDARVFSCLVELGVALTHEPGFHQIDIRGDLFGFLSAHPLTPLLSLHHLDNVESIFPNVSQMQALEHLFKAVKVDPTRILQQTVCYDRSNSRTFSVSWGYTVQVFEGNHYLPDLISLQRTFTPWQRGRYVNLRHFMFKMRDFPRDPCQRPSTFFFESIHSGINGTQSNYRRYVFGNCTEAGASKNLERIRIHSQKLDLDIGQLQAPRRHCCDILPSFDKWEFKSTNGEHSIPVRTDPPFRLAFWGRHSSLLHLVIVQFVSFRFEYYLLGYVGFPSIEIKMSLSPLTSMNLSSNRLANILLVLSSLCTIYFIASLTFIRNSSSPESLLWTTSSHFSTPTSLDHVVFGIASSAKSWPQRKDYVRLWWKPQQMRGCVFLDTMPSGKAASNDALLPPICISEDTSQFRYTNKHGYRSAIRVARIVLETVALNHSNVRWFVFGEDNTVFLMENLVKTLSKYDHNLWYYIGSGSESFEQTAGFSTEMAFGGGGFAISHSLARVLANTLDSCLVRYPHLYGSDSRIFSCLTELGIGLTHELGFHQVDIRGDPFGVLAAHPLTPLVSLHNLDSVEPIFPNMTRLQALQHLFKAVKFDPARVLQQTVCYDRWFSLSISISWGYAVQVLEGYKLLPDLLPVEKTFKPWKTKETMYSNLYTFTTRELPIDLCKRPTIFFLESICLDGVRVKSIYRRVTSENCLQSKRLEYISVFSDKMDLDIRQLQAPRRHCCDILSSSIGNVMDISIRECRKEESIFMHP
ncbi:hypothetical protein NE237_002075 [Protea cynaroides]|uniref:Uncharacterized protein n=1 Tax=Protea cynaroides TaxID=273540 RepID=A0A9Q0KUR3_9MAGN|nr:hypothetical protein NE237_002075 [Protea cynaroides]